MCEPVEEHDVHGSHDGQTYAAYRVADQGHVVAVKHQPAGHPRQRGDAEDHVGSQVEHAVDAIHGGLGQARHAEHLTQVEEDGVDLDQQGHHCKAHIATAEHGDPKTSYHL